MTETNQPSSPERLAVLREEAQGVAAAIRQLDQTSQHVIALAVAAGALLVPSAARVNSDFLLMALPLVLVGVAAYALNAYSQVLALGGYRRWLEESINRELGVLTLQWELHLAPGLHRIGSSTVLWSLLVLFTLGSAFFGAVLAWSELGTVGGAVYGLSVSILLLALVLQGRRLPRELARAHDRCLKAYESGLAGREKPRPTGPSTAV